MIVQLKGDRPDGQSDSRDSMSRRDLVIMSLISLAFGLAIIVRAMVSGG